MSRVLVIGDIHGSYRALIQCLRKARFDYKKDCLICLGDVCDGWPDTKLCIDELLKIKHLVFVMGNHDTWLLDWMQTGDVENIWYVQGGEATIDSYAGSPVPSAHVDFLQKALPYFLWENKLFVHAGIDPALTLAEQTGDILYWDRALAKAALSNHQIHIDTKFAVVDHKLTPYEEVYLGHTPIRQERPLYSGGVWLMDTGAGWDGVLSMMDIYSKEVFTSDPSPMLYPGFQGRQRI
jgi:Predicted phosphoesterases, related to the Icc protein